MYSLLSEYEDSKFEKLVRNCEYAIADSFNSKPPEARAS